MSSLSRWFLAVLVMLASSAVVSADDAADAKAIVNLAGSDVGLCVHLGCGREGSPALLAELAQQSRMLVHGLALDDASLARARDAAEARGVTGRAGAERVALDRLPYRRDLANLVVVEDMAALAAGGVTRDEILRVLAPGGVLCEKRDGRWTKTVKPRPNEMDDWTHPNHGADGNMVSEDKLVGFPLGFRWIDGLPMNLNRWAACRAWVVAEGRLFMLTANQYENLGGGRSKPHYLAAHNAWNGLPLWKINCETTDDGAFLTWVNHGALVTDGKRVYAATKDKAIGVDAASGEVAVTYQTQYAPARLLLSDGVLVASCWAEKKASDSLADARSLWATWVPGDQRGSVEAFDAASGARKWVFEGPAQTIVADDDTVYLLVKKGNPPDDQAIVALDLKDGKERWRVPHTRYGQTVDLQLTAAGKGWVVTATRGPRSGLGASKPNEGEKPFVKGVYILASSDGRVLWKIVPAGAVWTPVVDGNLWHGGKKYDILTGKDEGRFGWGVGDQSCTPQTIVNNYIVRPRGGQYLEVDPKGSGKVTDLRYGGARGACIEGMVPANGMFYTAQNNCRCAPGQVYGFVAVGPCGDMPGAADFERAGPAEPGPAFGRAKTGANAAGDWPTYRHDGERRAASAGDIPSNLIARWRTQVASPYDGPLAEAWRARLGACLSAPVVAGGRVFAAATDAGRLAALDADTGKTLWKTSLPSRVDTPPTVVGGLAVIGCHDGWVYAYDAATGVLAWRSRIAPAERRMVAYGRVESVWPVVGTVLLHDGMLYASAGRTSESDGGIAVVALDPATGRQQWRREISEGPLRQNDLLCVKDGRIAWQHIRLDAKTGEGDLKAKPSATDANSGTQGGIVDGVWTRVGNRRSGRAFNFGGYYVDLATWNDTHVVAFHAGRVLQGHALGAAPPDAKKPLWQLAMPGGRQVEAIALAGSSVVAAGRVTGGTIGAEKGFLQVVSLADGRNAGEFPLEAAPVYDGLAVATGRVYASLANGELLCLGEAGK